MKKITILIFITLVTFKLNAQSTYFSVGIGGTFFGSGDELLSRVETKVGYHFNNRIKGSFHFAQGMGEQYKSTADFFDNVQNTFKEYGLEVGWSPFSKKNELGKGFLCLGFNYLNYVHITNFGSRIIYDSANEPLRIYLMEMRRSKSIGFGIFYDSMSYSTFLGESFGLGFRLGSQLYLSGDINHSAMFCIGYKL